MSGEKVCCVTICEDLGFPHRSAPHVEYVLEYVLERKRVDDLAGRRVPGLVQHFQVVDLGVLTWK